MSRILVIDDVYSELQLMLNALAPLGADIITAMDGIEGEKKILELRPDVVVMDVILPQKNGFQICRDIKKNPETRDIPIILISMKNQDSDKFWGMKQGADEYITKPFNPQDLMQAVARFLK